MGTTDPAKAAQGTIRQKYGIDIDRNVMHASDSPQTAMEQAKLFFGEEGIREYASQMQKLMKELHVS